MMSSLGTGKSVLAQRLPTILPPLTLSESLETTRICSAMSCLVRRATDVVAPLLRTAPSAKPGGAAAVCLPPCSSVMRFGLRFPTLDVQFVHFLAKPAVDRCGAVFDQGGLFHALEPLPEITVDA